MSAFPEAKRKRQPKMKTKNKTTGHKVLTLQAAKRRRQKALARLVCAEHKWAQKTPEGIVLNRASDALQEAMTALYRVRAFRLRLESDDVDQAQAAFDRAGLAASLVSGRRAKRVV